MKNNLIILFAALLYLLPKSAIAQSAEADSIDVLHYDLTLDMGRMVSRQMCATAEITFVLTRSCNEVAFDIICDTLRGVAIDGQAVADYDYSQSAALVRIPLVGGQAGDTHTVAIGYTSRGSVENYGWGGLHMDNNIYYTLGVAFQVYPHNFGRSWFPCRDNFYDKATYRLTVTSKPGWSSICSGMKVSETALDDGGNTIVWEVSEPTPTYLVSVSSANWHIIERDYQGEYGSYPAIIGFTTHDSTQVYEAYRILEDVIPMYERCFGPYRWGRVGYISTPQGSMEHVQNIGLVSVCMASSEQKCQMTMCHELGHAWFGNLLTCATVGDMWINEGGASFCEEVAAEAAFGKEAADDYYQTMLLRVLRSAHIDDGGYLSLHDMPERITYGTTTYQQGAMVWHSLRGYLGDSVFYSCLQRLFDRCAFGNIGAEALRDSLSLYSGIDLTGFFDFHVFHPGFVDYSVDQFAINGNQAQVTLRQLLRGTTHYAFGNRVPLTFFSADRSSRKDVVMAFDDSVATQTFDLPFSPRFMFVDYDHQLSDACTDDTMNFSQRGVTDMPHSYSKIYISKVAETPGAWLHVAHHFAHPTGDTIEGIVRMADRYWSVQGNIPAECNAVGRFLYNQGSNGASGASFIDEGFYDHRNTLDSICLMYRPDATHSWMPVSRQRTSASTIASGHFTYPLACGEYTLAVADPAMPLGIASAEGQGVELTVYPNPAVHGEFTIDLGAYDQKFNVEIIDTTGRKVLQKKSLHSGDKVRHNLSAGTYILLVKNNFLSLQSQIIVQ